MKTTSVSTPSTTTIAGQIALHPAPIASPAFVHAAPTASPQGLSALSYTVAAHEASAAPAASRLAHVHADETVDDGGEGHHASCKAKRHDLR